MKSLNRTLSLVLVLVMVFGLFGVASASATTNFTDTAKITNTEAVNTMVSLGVINGKDGNVFDPTGSVTRAEMAKMICFALNGGKAPALGTSTASFKDTANHWASQYIEYCVSLGIIAGRGDGTFAPEATVTGSEAAKMILCALGYKASIEKLTGASWELSTNVIANKIGLYDGIKGTFSPSVALNRDNSAQVLYNAVQAYMVEYRNLQGDYSGVLYPVNQSSMLTARFGVVKVTAIAQANDKIAISGAAAKTGESRVAVQSISGITTPGGGWPTMTFSKSIDDSFIGQQIVLYVKFQNNLSPNASGAAVLGNPVATDNNTVVSTYAMLKDADAVKDAIKTAGIKVDNTEVEYGYTSATPTVAAAGTGANGVIFGIGTLQTFIDNDDDGIVDIIFIKSGSVDKVKNVNTASATITFNGLGAKDAADVVCATTLAKDDYVLVTKYDDGKYYATKCTAVQGKVTSFAPGAAAYTNKITVADKTYYPSNFANNSGDLTTGISFASSNIGATVALYLDTFGNIAAFKSISGVVENYGLVLDATVEGNIAMGGVAKVKILAADGTKAVYPVNLVASYDYTIAGAAATAEAKVGAMCNTPAGTPGWFDGTYTNLKNQIFAYTKSDTGVVTLYNPQILSATDYANTSFAATNIGKNIASYTTGVGSALADASTLFFVQDSAGSATPTNVSVVKGLANLPSTAVAVGAGQTILYKGVSGNVAQAVFVRLGTGTFSASANYAYVSGTYVQTKVDGVNVYTYPVVFGDGKTGTLSSVTPNAEKCNVYKFSLDSKGLATFSSPAETINNVMVKTLGTGSVVLVNNDTGAAAGSFALASDAIVLNVTDVAKAGVYADKLAENQHIVFVANTDGNVKLAFIVENMLGAMTADITASFAAATANFTFTTAATQTVKIYVNDTVKSTTTGVAGATTVTAATLGVTGGETVKIVVSETNKDTRTLKFYPTKLTLNVAAAAAATVNTKADFTGTTINTGDFVAAGTTLYVRSNSVVNGREGLTATGVTLVVHTPGVNTKTSAIYSFVMPSANTTAVFTDANVA